MTCAIIQESSTPSHLHAAFHRQGTSPSMPADPSMPETVNRTVRLRLLPETVTKARQLAGTAGACRWVWNHFLTRQQCRWQCWQDYKIGSPPQVSFFRLARSSQPCAGVLNTVGCRNTVTPQCAMRSSIWPMPTSGSSTGRADIRNSRPDIGLWTASPWPMLCPSYPRAICGYHASAGCG